MSTMNLNLPRSAAPFMAAAAQGVPSESTRQAAGASTGFAGLLGEQVQRRAGDGAREGQRNAFDVPPARVGEPVHESAASPESSAPAPSSAGPSRSGEAARAEGGETGASGREPATQRPSTARRETGARPGDARHLPARPTGSAAAGTAGAAATPADAVREVLIGEGSAGDGLEGSGPAGAPQGATTADNGAAPLAALPIALATPPEPAPAPAQVLADWLARRGAGGPDAEAPGGPQPPLPASEAAATSPDAPTTTTAEASATRAAASRLATRELATRQPAFEGTGGRNGVPGPGAADAGPSTALQFLRQDAALRPDPRGLASPGAALASEPSKGGAGEAAHAALADPTAMGLAALGPDPLRGTPNGTGERAATAMSAAAAASAPLQPLQSFMPANPTPVAAAPAAQAVLATPVTAPDFARALGTQLTTFALDGVQQATLQLNPADMGPIAVSIVLDGANAQIDFAAAHAQTRQVIEAGLPSLAAALNDAGLMLAGGGVFEQPPGDPRSARQEGSSGPSDGRGGRAGIGEAGRAGGESGARRQAVVGLVDTYA